MIKQYLAYILIALWAISMIASNIVTWKVETWKFGSEETSAYKTMQSQTNTQLGQLSKDMKDSSANSVQLSQKIGQWVTSANAIEESFRHDNAAKTATVGCLNPFTPDWVRDLNTSPANASP